MKSFVSWGCLISLTPSFVRTKPHLCDTGVFELFRTVWLVCFDHISRRVVNANHGIV
jgi:hypothetical protein